MKTRQKKAPVETTTEETLIDPHDSDDVADTAAEEIEDQDPEVSEMEPEAEQDGEETSAGIDFADDAPEMDEFEAALTQDLMETDDEVESRADQDTSAVDDVSAELDDTQEDEPQVAEDRVPLRFGTTCRGRAYSTAQATRSRDQCLSCARC